MARGRKPKDNKPFELDTTAMLFPEHEWDYVDKAVERVKMAWMFHHNMNPDGTPMLLAFSGGKDSICLFFVCKKASDELGIPMEEMFLVQYNVTTVDPPELVQFIRELKKTYPFINLKRPEKNMWKLIEERRIPPTRVARYCCAVLKESSKVVGGYTLTGVRRAESIRRRDRDSFEILGKTKKDKVLLGDNTEERNGTESCMQNNTYVCNPIVDWSDEDVWHFIKGQHLPYCKLYDEGESRIGCIGCPMATTKERERDFARYPKFKEAYIRAFQKMIEAYPNRSDCSWKNGEDAFHWWLYEGENGDGIGQEEQLFEETDNADTERS